MAGNKNSGRTEGSKNKVTQGVKEVYAAAFHELQRKDKHKLVTWAKKNETEFYKLCTKLIPAEVHANVENKITEIKIVMSEDEYINGQATSEAKDVSAIVRH